MAGRAKALAWAAVAAWFAASTAVPTELSALQGAEPAPGPIIIDTDFGTADRPVPRDPAAADRITGRLPPGWSDNSAWAKVWIEYRPCEEAGRRFLRVAVTRCDEGRAQLCHALPAMTGEAYCRLTVTARSLTFSAFDVGFRTVGPPYDFKWSARAVLSPQWRDFSFDFAAPKSAEPLGLWLNADGVGEIDLGRLRLVRLTRDELIEDLKRRCPDGGPRNLLKITRMPLGLQSGWTLGRDDSDGDDVTAAPDEQVTGPSGAAALALASQEKAVLWTAPFDVPWPFEVHTASMYVRGQGKGSLGVGVGGGTFAGRRFDVAGDHWQRVAVTFTPRLLARAHGLRIEFSGRLWIDALQVERGEQARQYASQQPCEVSLAVDSPARVQFDDEPATVRYAVTGPAEGAVLKARVVNAYGDVSPLPDVALGGGFLNRGQLQYDVFADRPYGPMRVEAWVERPAGRPVSPVNELVVYRLRRPRYWNADAPDSPFGTHTNSTTRHILMAKAVGVNWTRLHDAGTPYIGWYHLERKPGQWTFADKELHRFRRHGMKVLGALSTAPEWATYFDRPRDGYFDRFYQPRRMEDFENYVRTVAQRYRGVIDAWDVWNEPWIHAWWPVGYDETKKGRAGYVTSRQPQADFARLMAWAYKTVKSVDPSMIVLGVNSTADEGGQGSFSGQEWTAGVVAAGGLDHCDVVCYHHYTAARTAFPGDIIEAGYRRAIGPIIEKTGRLDKPVWMTEGSPNSGLGDGFYRHTLPYENTDDPFDAGDRLVRYIVSILSRGVRKVFLYSMHCHSYFGPGDYRVLVTPEGYLHPSAAAHAAMAWLLEDTQFVRRAAVAEGVTAYLFEGRGRAVAVLSPMPRHPPWSPPRAQGVAVTDLFGNPVPAGEPLGTRVVYMSAAGKTEVLERLLSKK